MKYLWLPKKTLKIKLKNILKNKMRGSLSTGSWAGAKYTKEGIPDILACIHGTFYGIEDKAPNGRPKLLQLVNLRKIRESGGVGVLLYPKDFEKFKALVNCKFIGYAWYKENIALQDEWYEKLK